MGLLDIASIRSIERGFNYYQSESLVFHQHEDNYIWIF